MPLVAPVTNATFPSMENKLILLFPLIRPVTAFSSFFFSKRLKKGISGHDGRRQRRCRRQDLLGINPGGGYFAVGMVAVGGTGGNGLCCLIGLLGQQRRTDHRTKEI